MRATSHVANPFGMLTDPEAFLRAIEGSERLKMIHGRVCRPLDRPVAPKGDGPQESSAFEFDSDDDGELPAL
jgi:hypothetical protein